MTEEKPTSTLLDAARVIDVLLQPEIDRRIWRPFMPRARVLVGWRGWCFHKWRRYRQLAVGFGLGVWFYWWIA